MISWVCSEKVNFLWKCAVSSEGRNGMAGGVSVGSFARAVCVEAEAVLY